MSDVCDICYVCNLSEVCGKMDTDEKTEPTFKVTMDEEYEKNALLEHFTNIMNSVIRENNSVLKDDDFNEIDVRKIFDNIADSKHIGKSCVEGVFRIETRNTSGIRISYKFEKYEFSGLCKLSEDTEPMDTLESLD